MTVGADHHLRKYGPADVEVGLPQDIYFACAVAVIHRDRVSANWRKYIIFLVLTCEILQFMSFAAVLARVNSVDVYPCPLGGSACPAYNLGSFCTATPHIRQQLQAFPEGAGMCLGCDRPLAITWCNETREEMESYPHLYNNHAFDWYYYMWKFFAGTSARNMSVGDIENMCEACTPTRYGKPVSFLLNNGTEVQYSDHRDNPQWNVGKMLLHDWVVLLASGTVLGLALGNEQLANFKSQISLLYPWACTGTGSDGSDIIAPPPQSRYVTCGHMATESAATRVSVYTNVHITHPTITNTRITSATHRCTTHRPQYITHPTNNAHGRQMNTQLPRAEY